ncbi:peptidase S8/S53 domain-containing protein [Lactarius quietus]|nr:peptidase S8/S53 domain-containing protein [Lactarius quietus]
MQRNSAAAGPTHNVFEALSLDPNQFLRTYAQTKQVLSGYLGQLGADATSAGPPDIQPGRELDADIQYLEVFVFPTPVIYYVAGRGPYIITLPLPPQTVSGSFSFNEDTLPKKYEEACRLFAQLRSRGVTVLFTTGNNSEGEGDCVGSDGLLKFRPTFLATCDYVTAVGGTTDVERKAMLAYLEKLGNQHRGLYNAQGRGVPGLSAQALGLKIVVNGNDRLSSSTGTTTALTANLWAVAGVVALLNDWNLFRQRRRLGFLNPWLVAALRLSPTSRQARIRFVTPKDLDSLPSKDGILLRALEHQI